MKKILFIMLEIDSASGICVSNVAEQMAKLGWEVDILAYPTKRKMDVKINKHDIRPGFFRYVHQRYRNNVLLSKMSSLGYKIKVALTIFMWPWNSPFFTMRLLNKVYHLYNLYKYNCIVPVYTQVDPIIVGYFLKRKYGAEVKVAPYFLDSLSAGPVPKLLKKKDKIKKGLKWEERLLSNADGVIYMESSKLHHLKYSASKQYFDKVEFLDIPAFCMGLNIADCKKEHVQEEAARCINITYVGSLPNGIRNPEYAFETMAQLKDLKIYISIVGVSEEDAKRFRTYNLDINWIGRVSHDEAIKYIMSSDILLNIGNRIEGMVPSKIFEYMSYAKPILSFSPINNEPSLAYLRKYPKACMLMEHDSVEINANKIREFIYKINEDDISLEEIRTRFYKNTPECFCDYINTLMEGKTRSKGM